jgi:glutamyl-tRNA synthetase
MRDRLAGLADWTAQAIEAEARLAADEAGLKLGSVAQPLRAALTGATASPGLFEVMRVLGRAETLNRLDDVASEAE